MLLVGAGHRYRRAAPVLHRATGALPRPPRVRGEARTPPPPPHQARLAGQMVEELEEVQALEDREGAVPLLERAKICECRAVCVCVCVRTCLCVCVCVLCVALARDLRAVVYEGVKRYGFLVVAGAAPRRAAFVRLLVLNGGPPAALPQCSPRCQTRCSTSRA